MGVEHDQAEVERVARPIGISEDELRERLRDWCLRSGQASVASKCRVSQPYISQMVAGKAGISTSVCLAMGYRKITFYTPHLMREQQGGQG